jgi:hypothetical protein
LFQRLSQGQGELHGEPNSFGFLCAVYTSRHPAGNQKPLLGGQSEGLRANIFLALPDSLYLCSDWINTMIKQYST